MQAPEMARVPLEELVLQIHLLGLGPAAQFLSKVSHCYTLDASVKQGKLHCKLYFNCNE